MGSENMKYDLIIPMLKTFYANEAAKSPSDREFDCKQIQSLIENLEQSGFIHYLNSTEI